MPNFLWSEFCDYSHCKQDPIYVFPKMKLRGLVPNFHIHVSVSDLYIPKIAAKVDRSWEYT
jgi:hypothetical protein